MLAGNAVMPEAVQAVVTGGAPVRLMAVIIGSAGLAHLKHDSFAPGPALVLLYGVVEQVDQQWLRLQSRGVVQVGDTLRGGDGAMRIIGLLRGHGRFQVGTANALLLPGLADIFARREDMKIRQYGQTRSGMANRLIDTAPMRVDGDGLIQRPGRRDSACGRGNGSLQGRGKRVIGMRGCCNGSGGIGDGHELCWLLAAGVWTATAAERVARAPAQRVGHSLRIQWV